MASLLWTSLYFTVLAQFMFIQSVISQEGPYPDDSSDLATFISRPDLKPPIFNLTCFSPDLLSSGYWFLAPYSSTIPPSTRNFEPAQAGPVIYDNQGNLIWSGGPSYQPRATMDFHVTHYNGTPHLSLLIYGSHSAPDYSKGAGLILDSSYEMQAEINGDGTGGRLNMHEFNVVNQGKSALIVHSSNKSPTGTRQFGGNQNIGFREVEIASGKIIFNWLARDHVEQSDSTVGETIALRDYFHLNSVDKNEQGDYLISSRHTNCIYKVSGVDGSIIWRLGGKKSSFIMEGFNISSQHHARFLEENDTTTVISFLNNASDGIISTASCSSAMIVALHTSTSPMTASVIARYDRPDSKLTELRGSVQVMPNKNIVVCWSENGYVSEFTAAGERILEASFTSMRFATYRAYKFNFSATPSEPPTLKAYAFGLPPGPIYTVYYVSWNGATEVAFWNFYGSKDPAAQLVPAGRVVKSGFETMFTFAGYFPWVLAEAEAADGSILGRSLLVSTIVPPGSDFTQSGQEEYIMSSNGDPIPVVDSGTSAEELSWPSWVVILIVIMACFLTAFTLFLFLYMFSQKVAFWYTPI